MRKLYLFFKFLFYTSLFFGVVGIGVAFYFYQHFSKDLPKLDSLRDYNPPLVSEVFADDGTKIGEFWMERRLLLKPDEIPKLVIDAITSAEDDQFFEHSGINYQGILRAMFENFKAGKIKQGGSSITQQVVKSFLLSNERSYERKIKEALLAKRIEDALSKSEILYLYLNQIFFGNRAYGVEAAAQNYFHKSAKELSIAEAAMLAGMPKAPDEYSPIKNYERARQRQLYVLSRMYETGHIDKQQLEKAKNQKLKIYHAPIDQDYNKRYASWFVEDVRRMVMDKYYDKNDPQKFYKMGLKIYTTVDLKAQNAAEKAIARGLSELHKRHGWSGPLKTLQPYEYDAFNAANHKNIFLSQLEPDLHHGLTEDEMAAKKTELQKDKIYEGLVTAVDKTSLTVQVGHLTGKILAADYGWARPRSEYTYFYEGRANFVPDATKKFHVGDVIEVKKVVPEEGSKIYTAGSTYLSLEQTPAPESAIFSHDPWTGYVKAFVGGKSFENSEFNRATQAVRQTGSVFKAMLYGSALASGHYKPDTSVPNTTISIPDGNKNWVPKNFGGKSGGAMSFKSALTNSVNLCSVHILLSLGMHYGTHYATGFVRNLGITTPLAKVPSMALGANDMKLSEVVHAIGTYPTGGINQDLIFIKKIVDRYGNVKEENKPRKVKNFVEQLKDGDHTIVPDLHYDEDNVETILREDLWEMGKKAIEKDGLDLSPADKARLYGKHIPEGYTVSPYAAYNMVDVMQDIVNEGTAQRVKALGRPAAGKTGTTNDLTDVWFVGYVPDLVAGVWVGYDENKYKVGNGEQGGRTAAPIFLYYMKEYLEGTPIKKFEIPKEFNDPSLQPPSNVAGAKPTNLFIETPQNNNGNGAEFFLQDI